MLKKKFFIRYFLLLVIFVVAFFWYGATLLNMQIARADEYQRKIQTTYTKTFVVPAVRGEIFDRNGIPLVTNRNVYNIVIDGTKMPRNDYVGILIDLIDKINFYNGEIEQDEFPVMLIDSYEKSQEAHYLYSMMTKTERDRFDRFLTKNKLNINTSADELVEFLTAKYNLDFYMPLNEDGERDVKLFRTVLGICYDIDYSDVLAGSNPYKISEDINRTLMAVIMENSHNYPGAEVLLSYERVYNIPTSAPHILGRVGSIQAEKLDWYLERGYSMDAEVGTSGIELAFEEYLRGVDGILERTYDQDNNLLYENWYVDRAGNIREPVAGKDVYLTLDIKLQQVAEYSIEKTIGKIHNLALKTPNPQLNGADANAGATAVINPNTGEVLAIATYPSFDISTAYSDPKIYKELSESPDNPFTNRATMGQYAPGSVFKIVTATAALEHGDLTVNDTIVDQGKYTRYQGYQPTCWYYPHNHGRIGVTKAIEVSCNYFFYVVGERTGIKTLNDYSRRMGLGVKTGIEIAETPGILASPEVAEAKGEIWAGGQLLQASIGQSYNVFSPLQTATMLGTFLNGGQRYKNTLLLCVKEYGSDEIYYSPAPEIIESFEISETNYSAVKLGLRNVIELGTAAALFNNIPVRIGGKTGTVEIHVGQSSENATFVAFAPYDKPEISMSVVIEKGSMGTWAGFVAEDVLAYYFGSKSFEESMDLPIEIYPEETDEANIIQ
ncbi:MAG: penicillin-binding transpeptidase domain-containing protein [Oscillospiraceae bacterium]|nr:penicillin-binding transpeptidase domain-containing protein [Oscillospiraceae bacterium]